MPDLAPPASAPAPPAPPPAGQAAAPRAGVAVTIEQLRALADQRPWTLLELLQSHLAEPRTLSGLAPEVRLLAAAAFTKLGLRTPALAVLAHSGLIDDEALCVKARALRDLAFALPDDRVHPDEQLALVDRNLASLRARTHTDPGSPPLVAERGPPLTLRPDDHLLDAAREAWRAALPARPLLRSTDGNVLRCVLRALSGVDAYPSPTRLCDDRSSAREGLAPLAKQTPAPVYLQGLSPPWALRELVKLKTSPAGTPAPRLVVLHADVPTLLDAMGTIDLSEELACPHLDLLLGEHASAEHFAALLRARLGTALGATAITVPATARATPLAPLLRDAAESQQREFAALKLRLTRADRGEAPFGVKGEEAWLAWRFAHGWSEHDTPEHPLRVLIPTSRFTTFVRHAAHDAAGSLRRLGCDVRVWMEPADSLQLTPLGLLREVDRFEPDLILSFNHTRAQMPDGISHALPVVTWVQDAMPHLFASATGAAQGPLDVLVGHGHEEFFRDFGFPRSRALRTSVLACDRKFHAAPVDAQHRSRFACDIALVSHHSATPEALIERLVRQLVDSTGPRGQRLEAAVREVCRAAASLAQPGLHTPALASLRRLCEDALAAHAPDASPELRGTLLHTYAMPVYERALRHQTLRWSHAIAQRRGWSLRLYGSGWEQHPTLSVCAAGPVEHGEDLRACYQSARAHLHASLAFSAHQRVYECALSGGMPLVRLKRDDLDQLRAHVSAAVSRSGAPARTTLAGRQMTCDATDHPAALRWIAQQQRLGLPADKSVVFDYFAWLGTHAEPDGVSSHDDAVWVMGDLDQTCFWDEPSLEAALERAITRPAWRESASRGIASRVRTNLTYRAFLPRVLRFVGNLLRERSREAWRDA